MKQIIVIHGGDSFSRYEDYINYLKNREVTKENFQPKKGWKSTIASELTEFDFLIPKMPNATNAVFEEWKIWFERMIPFMTDEVILVGHSLGGMFLSKYLANYEFTKKILQLHLVAPPHNQTEDIADFFLPEDLSKVMQQSPNTFLYFSSDDPLVPFLEMEKYKAQLPKAKFIIFKDRGHFKQDEFPELVENIKGIL